MGYVCRLDTTQFLNPWNYIGHCPFHFMVHVDFYKMLDFEHSHSQKPSFSKTWNYWKECSETRQSKVIPRYSSCQFQRKSLEIYWKPVSKDSKRWRKSGLTRNLSFLYEVHIHGGKFADLIVWTHMLPIGCESGSQAETSMGTDKNHPTKSLLSWVTGLGRRQPCRVETLLTTSALV